MAPVGKVVSKDDLDKLGTLGPSGKTEWAGNTALYLVTTPPSSTGTATSSLATPVVSGMMAIHDVHDAVAGDTAE